MVIISNENSSVHWVVVRGDNFINFIVPSWSIVKDSVLHLKSIRISIEGLIIFDFFSLEG